MLYKYTVDLLTKSQITYNFKLIQAVQFIHNQAPIILFRLNCLYIYVYEME